MNLLLIVLILLLVLPAAGIYVVAGTIGLVLKVLLIVLIVGLLVNVLGGNRNFWF